MTMKLFEEDVDASDSFPKAALSTQAGELSEYVGGPWSPSQNVTVPTVLISTWRASLDDIHPWAFHGPATSEFQEVELITDFPGEPYIALKGIPVTVRDLDIGYEFEAAFEESNIAWVASSKVEAVNGLKAEILNSIEDFEVNENRLGSETARQLDILRTYVRRTR